jgi:hypothetical protein
MAFIGYSPPEIDRLDAERGEDQAGSLIGTPQAAPGALVAV